MAARSNKRKFFMVGTQHSKIMSMFLQNGGWTASATRQDADIVVFGGGPDLNPVLYGEKTLPSTKSKPGRDKFEEKMFNKAFRDGIPMIGICRGAQLLNVLSGGSLWQHVDGHNEGPHLSVDAPSGNILLLNSYHHQMMRPSKRAKLMAYSHCCSGKESEFSWVYEVDVPEPEVLVYEHTKSLCFQPHPEEVDKTSTRQYFFDTMDDFLEEVA